MKKPIFKTILMVLSLSIIVGAVWLNEEQKALSEKIIRLHVVANSDSDRDQAIKLEVRDAVLKVTQSVVGDTTQNPEEVLRDSLDNITLAANNCLNTLGVSNRAVVSLEKEMFPTREYDTFSLPAGTYTALRVNIGEAEGQNWWCVVFPTICMSASMDEMENAAAVAGMSEGEVKLITEDSRPYELKFKSIEILENLKNKFFGNW